jgi:hypothetical protein
VSLAFDIAVPAALNAEQGPVLGDRLILRLAIAGQADRYTVFERAHTYLTRGFWHRATDNLTAIELLDWPLYRRRALSGDLAPFDAWLRRHAGSRR